MTKLNYKYLAGLFDGEGHITIGKRQSNPNWNPQYYLSIGVTNTNKIILERIKDTLKTGRVVLNSRGYKRENPRICYSWVATSRIAQEVLKKIVPHLQIKKERAVLALSFQGRLKPQGNFHPVSKEEILVRESLRNKLMELNKK